MKENQVEIQPFSKKTVQIFNNIEYQVTKVIPFYSHTKKEPYEEEDEKLGISNPGRRVFSNLFPSKLNIKSKFFPSIYEEEQKEQIVFHDFLLENEVPSVENFFQSTKSLLEADARFIALHLNPSKAAGYGQGRYSLSTKEKNQLIQLGVNPSDFVVSKKKRVIRSKTGYPPRIENWDHKKIYVMLAGLRLKFKEPNSEFRYIMDTLIQTKENFLFIEHTKNDKQWADGLYGNGTNFLGKLLTQIFLEIRNETEYKVDKEFLLKPNKEFVEYKTNF
ncbi:hypothetical protein M0811_06888 [Anaeramoeba ignava]|uniref:NADAR domain-containing protein n=1 Tax=Anaeramoeba ignava TaxID=1746090 RepID=A0A9Q0LM40_ANAIG|nr:hypothetical protein M0811_06888 [Anaeramoeba ignava]